MRCFFTYKFCPFQKIMIFVWSLYCCPPRCLPGPSNPTDAPGGLPASFAAHERNPSTMMTLKQYGPRLLLTSGYRMWAGRPYRGRGPNQNRMKCVAGKNLDRVFVQYYSRVQHFCSRAPAHRVAGELTEPLAKAAAQCTDPPLIDPSECNGEGWCFQTDCSMFCFCALF